MRQQIVMLGFLWLALQVPLGGFIGEWIHFGMAERPAWRPRAKLL